MGMTLSLRDRFSASGRRGHGFLNQKTGMLYAWIYQTRKSSLTVTAISNIDCTVQYILYYSIIHFDFYNLVSQFITT